MASIDDVQDISPRVQYTAIAAQTVFAYPFPIFVDADIVVDVDGVTKVLTTDYTVSGAGNETGGNVTFVVAMTGDEVVTIYRDIAIERSTDFQQNGPWSSATFNDELDKLYLIIQELENKVGRAIRFPITSASTNAQAEMAPISNFFEKFLRITSAGLLEAADVLDGVVTLSAEIIGALLYPQTALELAAGITPTTFRYVPGDVRRYGTVGDGATVDTAALQRALDSGHKVLIPDNTYITNELSVSSNTVIEFESRNAILKLATAAPVGDNILTNSNPTGGNADITIIGGKTDGNRVARAAVTAGSTSNDDNNISMVKITRLRIDGHFATSATRHGINTNGNGTPIDEDDYLDGEVSSDVKVTNCFATDCGDDGITLHHTDNGLVSNNICWDMAATLANNSNGIEIEDGCRHVTVTDNFCFNINEYDATVADTRVRSDAAGSFMRRGIDVEASAGQPSPQNIKIVDNHVWHVWKGIDARRDGDTTLGTPKNIEICNNNVSDCQSTLIRVVSYIGYLIDDNTVEGEQSNALSTSDGILITDDAGDGVISNNRVANLPTLSRGIAIRSGAGDEHTISVNRVKNAGSLTSIFVEGAISDVSILGNPVTAAAGASSGIAAVDAIRLLVSENRINGSPTQQILNPGQTGANQIYRNNHPDTEPQTGTDSANLAIYQQIINSNGGAVTSTLGDGKFVGQRMIFTMSDASNSSTVSVTTHETESPEVFTFAQTTDVLILEWTGALWWTVKNIGVAV